MSIFALLILTYWVSFTDKYGSNQVALSDRALELRQQYDIAIDSLDYPVSAVYLDSLRAAGAVICHTSRWMNGATAVMTDSLAQEVGSWSFVSNVEKTYQASSRNLAPQRNLMDLGLIDSTFTKNHTGVINLKPLHDAGYQGQGIVMAIMDCGYPGVDTMRCFRSLREEDRLLGMCDYTIEDAPMSSLGNKHGTYCATLMLGQTSLYQGAAPKASAYLIRTEEVLSESPKEPDNWIAAIEFCDSVGVQVASTSLGYFRFDAPFESMTYSQLDGKTMRSSRAALIAARKGMLLCMAIGNNGQDATWHWTHTPGDADSIITVGAVDKDSVIAPFSSYGNTSDGRLKPEVCGMGYACYMYDIVSGKLFTANGTSYACPIIAGMAACIWSAHPDENAQQIRQRILTSSHLYEQPQQKYGYGIPNAYEAAGRPMVSSNEVLKESAPVVIKIIRHGQLYLWRNGQRMDLLGRIVE